MMYKSNTLALASFFCAWSLQAQSEPHQESKPLGSTPLPPTDKNPPAFDVSNMDKSVKPSDDFYTYANGGWLKKNPIPPEESRWGSFNMLIEKNNAALQVVAEKAAQEAAGSGVAAGCAKGGRLLRQRNG